MKEKSAKKSTKLPTSKQLGETMARGIRKEIAKSNYEL
jgi:hypothetical protein